MTVPEPISAPTKDLLADIEALGQRLQLVRERIGRVIFGQREVVDQALITLLAFLSCAFAPSVVNIVYSVHDNPDIRAIDVCDSADPTLIDFDDMPCISSGCCHQPPHFTVTTTEQEPFRITHTLFALENERPPKA